MKMDIEWLRPWQSVASYHGCALPQRINFVGKTGSGKTTMAARLAAQIDAPHIELDALNWGPNWTPVPRPRFEQAVRDALTVPRWVVDGNYSSVRSVIMPALQLMVWLDYPLPVSYWRLTRRGLRRIVTRENLWQSGNREHARSMFASRDSLYVWAYKSHRTHRLRYPAVVNHPDWAHVALVRLRSPAAAERWLTEFWQQ